MHMPKNIEGVEDYLGNPYDAEMKNSLTCDKIRIAGSNTFLEVTGNEVSARHTTVKEFFSKSETPTKYQALAARIAFAQAADSRRPTNNP